MTDDEWREQIMEKAEHLYCVLRSDPLRVPILEPKNIEYYPDKIAGNFGYKFWCGLVEELQIMKPETSSSKSR